ncbi:unnamed protein product, partial [Scytosiphon promiscuus]
MSSKVLPTASAAPYDAEPSAPPEPAFPSLRHRLSSTDESTGDTSVADTPASAPPAQETCPPRADAAEEERITRLGSGWGQAPDLAGDPGFGSTQTEAAAGAWSSRPDRWVQDAGRDVPDVGAVPPARPTQAGFLTALGKLGNTIKDGIGSDAKGEGGGGGGGGGRNRQSERTAKVLRSHVASFAEKHHQDVSAEINSLSKISSQDEAEEDSRFLLNHESSEKLAWDIVMMFLIIFSAFDSPMQIAFHVDEVGVLWFVEVVVDFVFLVDVGLNFRTTVMDADTKETITDIGEISARYLKGWFTLDIVSSLPVALVSHLVDATAIEKYLLMLKLLRTLKLHQLSVITNAVLQRFEDRDFNPAVFRIYIFVLAFVLVVHFIACGYWWVSRVTDPDFEGLWTPEQEYLDIDLHLQYARAVYYSLVITYGNDLKPENNTEYVFSNICLTLALLTNAVIIGSATNLLSNMDAGAVAKKTQLDGINGYMRFRKVPKGLQKRIRTFYEYLWDSGQDSYSSALFEEMPDKLKLQLNIALKKRLIDQVPLFKTFSPAGTIALVQNLVSSIILPGELIVRQGEPATSMFFISRGTVRVFVLSEGEDTMGSPPEESYIISLGAGSFFGEVALLEEEHLRTANVRAETFTELQVMHADDFHALAEVFPEFKTAVQGISESRVKAGAALGRMKARGKGFAGKTTRSHAGGETRSLKMMRNAVFAVKAENETKQPPEERRPKMRIFVDRLMGTH